MLAPTELTKHDVLTKLNYKLLITYCTLVGINLAAALVEISIIGFGMIPALQFGMAGVFYQLQFLSL